MVKQKLQEQFIELWKLPHNSVQRLGPVQELSNNCRTSFFCYQVFFDCDPSSSTSLLSSVGISTKVTLTITKCRCMYETNCQCTRVKNLETLKAFTIGTLSMDLLHCCNFIKCLGGWLKEFELRLKASQHLRV